MTSSLWAVVCIGFTHTWIAWILHNFPILKNHQEIKCIIYYNAISIVRIILLQVKEMDETGWIQIHCAAVCCRSASLYTELFASKPANRVQRFNLTVERVGNVSYGFKTLAPTPSSPTPIPSFISHFH